MVFVYSNIDTENIDGDKKSTLRPPVTKKLFECNILKVTFVIKWSSKGNEKKSFTKEIAPNNFLE